jgi:hypothetical protein
MLRSLADGCKRSKVPPSPPSPRTGSSSALLLLLLLRLLYNPGRRVWVPRQTLLRSLVLQLMLMLLFRASLIRMRIAISAEEQEQEEEQEGAMGMARLMMFQRGTWKAAHSCSSNPPSLETPPCRRPSPPGRPVDHLAPCRRFIVPVECQYRPLLRAPAALPRLHGSSPMVMRRGLAGATRRGNRLQMRGHPLRRRRVWAAAG